jgi:hypothetical protein
MVILGSGAPERSSSRTSEVLPPAGAERAVPSGPVEPSTGADRPRRRLALAALVVVIAFGAALRANGLTTQGLWRDDAWVALSGHVGLGEAWHMWATAPGTYLVDRTVLVLASGSTLWAQMPAFVSGLAAIPATYALARCFRLSRLSGVLMAAAIALAPLCVIYSTRVKEYELDVLLSCAVLATGEVARRTPGSRQFATLAAASVGAFLCSATLGVVIAGVWVALAVQTWRGRRRGWPRHVVVAGVAAVCGCGAVALVFYDRISPSLHRFWATGFVSHQSFGSFVSSLGWVAWHLLADVVGLGPLSVPLRVALLGLWVVVAVVGLRGNRSMLAPALVLVVAVLGSVAGIQPLGTGRTDQYLYPALLLLTAAGLTPIAAVIARDVGRRPRGEVRAIALATGAVGVLALGLLAAFAWSVRPNYPAVDVTALAAQIDRHEQPGDHIFVSELARYPWALAEDPHPDVRLGTAWAAGFTVVSTQPGVFIVPSEYYEGGSHPEAWAAAVHRDHRLWYVWSAPLSLNPSYRALLADGWRPRVTLDATGISATLLVRP